jgi:hypothetical protein
MTPARPGWDDARQEPTPASVWHAVAGTAIGDDLLEWPADLFALTEVILQRSEGWSAWTEDRNGAIPALLAQEWEILWAQAGIPLDQLAEARDWRLCQALWSRLRVPGRAWRPVPGLGPRWIGCWPAAAGQHAGL